MKLKRFLLCAVLLLSGCDPMIRVSGSLSVGREAQSQPAQPVIIMPPAPAAAPIATRQSERSLPEQALTVPPLMCPVPQESSPCAYTARLQQIFHNIPGVEFCVAGFADTPETFVIDAYYPNSRTLILFHQRQKEKTTFRRRNMRIVVFSEASLALEEAGETTALHDALCQ
jgi:hypothetical protein